MSSLPQINPLELKRSFSKGAIIPLQSPLHRNYRNPHFCSTGTKLLSKLFDKGEDCSLTLQRSSTSVLHRQSVDAENFKKKAARKELRSSVKFLKEHLNTMKEFDHSHSNVKDELVSDSGQFIGLSKKHNNHEQGKPNLGFSFAKKKRKVKKEEKKDKPEIYKNMYEFKFSMFEEEVIISSLSQTEKVRKLDFDQVLKIFLASYSAFLKLDRNLSALGTILAQLVEEHTHLKHILIDEKGRARENVSLQSIRLQTFYKDQMQGSLIVKELEALSTSYHEYKRNASVLSMFRNKSTPTGILTKKSPFLSPTIAENSPGKPRGNFQSFARRVTFVQRRVSKIATPKPSFTPEQVANYLEKKKDNMAIYSERRIKELLKSCFYLSDIIDEYIVKRKGEYYGILSSEYDSNIGYLGELANSNEVPLYISKLSSKKGRLENAKSMINDVHNSVILKMNHRSISDMIQEFERSSGKLDKINVHFMNSAGLINKIVYEKQNQS